MGGAIPDLYTLSRLVGGAIYDKSLGEEAISTKQFASQSVDEDTNAHLLCMLLDGLI